MQNADTAAGIAAVATDVDVGGIGTDDGDGFQFGEIERQQVLVILEQHDDFLRGLKRECLMFGAVVDALGVVGIDVGIVEEAEAELGGENARDGLDRAGSQARFPASPERARVRKASPSERS